MTTRLLLLPNDPDDSDWLEIDPSGRIVHRAAVPPGSRPPLQHDRPGRTWAVVPATGVGLAWTALPARQQAQALAAARLVLDDLAAAPVDTLHIAVSPFHGTTPRVLAWVAPAVMQGWLARVQAHGVDADALVPDVLLLQPDDHEPDRPVAAEHDGRWLVRGGDFAFAAEPALARQVLGERAARVLPPDTGFADACARAAALEAAPLDLLQGAFAPRTRRQSTDGWRRAAVLAGVLALSPWLLMAADAIRHEVAARQLQAQARAVAARVAPEARTGDPLTAAATRLSQLQAVDALARDAGALFRALDAAPGTHLDSLRFSIVEGLRAQVVHPRESDLDAIAAALAEAGLPMQRVGQQPAGDAVRSDVALGPDA